MCLVHICHYQIFAVHHNVHNFTKACGGEEHLSVHGKINYFQ